MRLFFWILISIISISCFFQTNFIYANSSTSTTVLSSQSFQKLGIEIEESIAGTYFAGDGILIRGLVTNKKEYAMVFLQNAQTGEEFSELARTDSGGYFKIPLLLPKITGKYYIIIASGNSFETTTPEAITLVSRDALFESKSTILSSIPNIVYDNNSSYLSFGSDIWSNISIQQGGKTIETSGKILVLSDLPLTSGEAKIHISGYHLSGASPLDRILGTEFIYSGTILIDRTRDRIGKEFTTLRNRKSLATMQFRLKSGERVSSTYYLSSPNGNVMKNTFPSNVIDASGFLHTNILIRQNFQIPEIGVYKIETVRDNGYAYFNLPISRSQFWSIGESMSKIKKTTLRSNKDLIDEDILSRINLVRKTLSRDPLEKDSKLMELAQKKAMDMAEYNYVGHITHSGKNILDFAKSIQIDITGSIGENVAGGNVSDIHLQDGLEESGSHKYNMINPKWKHIGIGYVLKNGRTYFVQVFGE